MKQTIIRHMAVFTSALIAATSLATGLAGATSTMADSATKPTADQAQVKRIIARGDKEIARRLTNLNALASKINGAPKLSADDKVSLTSEVNVEISNLNTLKIKLDAETTADSAKADAQSIITDYRVYALIVPKVNLVRTADDQLATEAKLTALATKLQARIDAAKAKNKDVTLTQTGLNTLNNELNEAQSISSSVESSVINLQPSDYNADHTILSGDRDQLKKAQNDIAAVLKNSSTTISRVSQF